MLKFFYGFMTDDMKIAFIDRAEDKDIMDIVFSIKDKAKRIIAIDKIIEDYFYLTYNLDETKKIEIIQESKKLDTHYKASLIISLSNDLKKIEILQTLEGLNGHNKATIIETIKDEKERLELMDKIDGLSPSDKAIIVASINDDEKKIELLQTIEGLSGKNKAFIIKSINDEEKKIELLQTIEGLSGKDKAKIIGSLNSEEKKIELLQTTEGLDSGDKATIIFCIESIEKKIELMRTIEGLNGEDKYGIITSIRDYAKRLELVFTTEGITEEDKEFEIGFFADQEKIEVLQTVQGLTSKDKAQIIASINNEENKIELLQTIEGLTGKDKAQIIGSLNSDKNKIELMRITEGLDINDKAIIIAYIENENKKVNIAIEENLIGDNELNLLKRLKQKNSEILKNIDFRILQKKYVDLLGEERINTISCYLSIQERILELSDEELNIFDKCIDVYVEKYKTDEWTVIAEDILNNIGEYEILVKDLKDIKNISEEDVLKISRIIQNENWCEIQSIEDVREYDRIKEEKCKRIMEDKDASLESKKEATIQKLFGHSLSYAKEMLHKYGKDIENIDDCDMKDYIRALKLIDEIEEIDLLEQIFEKCNFAELDRASAERNLKIAYLKTYLGDLYVPKEEDRVEGEKNVYDAGTDFKILLTSVGAYYGGEKIWNYNKSWNMPIISTQHFCASYIRNDMLGTAPIPHFCYGFKSMKEDSLMLSGPFDLGSSNHTFNSKSYRNHGDIYYTSNTQIDNTKKHNEMDFRRMQGGEKKQPDYIVVFKRNGKIDNMNEARKAAKQWEKELPIVVIDVDKCLKSERAKVDKMLSQYRKNPNPQLAKIIKQKVRNNRVTDTTFCEDINSELEELRVDEIDKENPTTYEESEKKDKKEKKQTKGIVDEEQLAQVYEEVSAHERSERSK